jgi:hypothetical protein
MITVFVAATLKQTATEESVRMDVPESSLVTILDPVFLLAVPLHLLPLHRVQLPLTLLLALLLHLLLPHHLFFLHLQASLLLKFLSLPQLPAVCLLKLSALNQRVVQLT